MTIDNNFRRGSKGSSSFMTGLLTPVQILQFMKSSFYLPVDVLKAPNWKVSPIEVLPGAKFANQFSGTKNLHCAEEWELLVDAKFVAISQRYNRVTKTYYYVAKIWYGKEPL